MSVASPVLERKLNTEEESDYEKERNADSAMSADEKHNSQISSNYAKLINPEYSLKDIIKKEAEPVQTKEPLFTSVNREVRIEKPYRVENARATADIFRADSAVNRKAETKITVASTAAEEENEDLLPTKTTIQYRTEGVKRDTEEGKIENVSSKKRLTKKEKLIIAAVVSVIVALFVLIIINSAIISGVSNDLSYLQTSLDSAKESYVQAVAEKQQYLEGLQDAVYEFATANGMIAE